ncbi:MAG TPA: adenylate/guanylate cyclase domain-containing protein [Candidatus Methylomirabilis sp.]|nr:adenylate/guanylate cyclase domain-containing protein [Candidatus Methylomirabilis sp.]
MSEPDPSSVIGAPRPWQRLSVRLSLLFAAVTLLAVGAVGLFTYERHQRELEDTVGTQLLNIARVAALLVDPALHAEVQRTRAADSAAYAELRKRLVAIQNEVLLTTPIYTLADFDPKAAQARIMVVSDGPGRPGEPYALAPELIDPLRWTYEDGVARYTHVYSTARGRWITAFAPIVDAAGRTMAVVKVDYPVEIYLDRLHELRATILYASVIGAVGTLILGLLFARRLTRPIRALTAGVTRVAAGDLSRALPVRSSDELGRLTVAFNQMLDGLRQRDFIRSAFGRYVSPEVAQQLLESPEGLRFGGEKRVVTVLMSDLRGYTRFAEQGDPARVMDVLNEYLARMTDIIVQHGGTINEFIGDAVFAVFGAPLAHADHAERAAACALAMQDSMAELNRRHATSGLPRFEMGIGVNTGEAVVGNIGSEQRAKYAVVGSAVNIAARVEGATVGGQVFITASTYESIREIAEVGVPQEVAAKGLSEPLRLYELRAMRGRYARSAPRDETDAEAEVGVALPIRCWVIDGKIIRPESVAGQVLRLGRREIAARIDTELPPLTNVRFRLAYPGEARESGDIYGKVVRSEPGDAALTRIHFTSVTDADAETIEALVGGPRGGGRPEGGHS